MKTNKLVLVLATFTASLTAVLLMAAPQAFAATATWTGAGGDTNMNTAGNWGGTAPVGGDDLVFPANITNRTVVNNYSGGTSFNSITFSGAISSTGSYTVSGNAMTVVAGISATMTGLENYQTISADLTFAASQTLTASINSFLYLDGSISIGTSAINIAANSGDVNISGVITGSGAITKTGAGTLGLSGNNSSYTGAITASGGQLSASGANAIATSGGTTIAAGAEIVLSDCSVSTFNGNLTLTGASVTPGSATPSPKLKVYKGGCSGGGAPDESYGTAADTTSLIFTGNITLGSDITFATLNKDVTFTGAISGAYAIKMLDGYAGKLIINASTNSSSTPNGTYTSTAILKTLSDDMSSVTLGLLGNVVLTLDGKRSDTLVSGLGAILKGTGSVTGILSVLSQGTVAPGHSPGCLVVGAGLVLSGTYQAELGGTTVCSGYDQLTVTGTVNITGGTLATSLYGGFKPAAGNTFTIIDNDASDAVTGTFTGLAEGATFTVDGYVFKISYIGGTGNDVVLTVISVPAVPDTGFTLLHANPYISLGATILMTGVLSLGFRRLNAVRVKK